MPDVGRSETSGQLTQVDPKSPATVLPGDIVIPIDGGTVPISGAQTMTAGVTFVVQGTLVATVTTE